MVSGRMYDSIFKATKQTFFASGWNSYLLLCNEQWLQYIQQLFKEKR